MKLPNIPSDNLYKFIAISGLVISILSGYLLVDKIDNLKKFENEIEIKENLQLLNNQTKNGQELVNNKFQNEITELKKKHSKRVKNFIDNIFIPLFCTIIFGFILAMIGFALWYYRTQKLLDEILRNERNKYKNEKDIFQYKFKYEKEVELYKSIWKPLSALRYGLTRLKVLQGNLNNKLITEGEYYKDIMEIFKIDILPYKTRFLVTVEENEPFFNKKILESIEQLRDKINELLKESIFRKEFKRHSEQTDIYKDINLIATHDNIDSRIRNLREAIYYRISTVEIID